MAKIKFEYDLPVVKCTKRYCYFCEKVKNNEGRADANALIKLGLVKKLTN